MEKRNLFDNYIQTYDFNTAEAYPIVGIGSITTADVGNYVNLTADASTRITGFENYIKDIIKESSALNASYAKGIGDNSTNIGGEEKFIYVSNGKITPANTNIGNSSTPIYLKDGVFTACTEMAPGGITEIPAATSSALGGIKTGYTSSDTDKRYAVKLDNNNNAYVKVDWKDLAIASDNTLGGIKTGYTTNGKNYKLQVDSNGNAYVNVPWTEATGGEADGNATYTLSINEGVIKLDGEGTNASDSSVDISDFVDDAIDTKLSNYSTTDTKNTTGSKDTKSTKRFLVGADTQAESVVTTTDVSVFITTSSEISAVDFIVASDERLKTFKDDVSIDFNKIKEIPKKYFTFNDDPDKVRIGTSAQQLQKVYPELVVYDESDDSYRVNYANLSVVALAAIDKLYEEIEYLKYKINKLENGRG